MKKGQEKEPEKLTKIDRLKAIDIEQVDLFLFNQKNKFTDVVESSERFMVIKDLNGKRYVFREAVDLKPKSGIVT